VLFRCRAAELSVRGERFAEAARCAAERVDSTIQANASRSPSAVAERKRVSAQR
jgi:hypothetical protein